MHRPRAIVVLDVHPGLARPRVAAQPDAIGLRRRSGSRAGAVVVSTDEGEAHEAGRRECACRRRESGLDGDAGFVRASLGSDAMRDGQLYGVSDVHLDLAP